MTSVPSRIIAMVTTIDTRKPGTEPIACLGTTMRLMSTRSWRLTLPDTRPLQPWILEELPRVTLRMACPRRVWGRRSMGSRLRKEKYWTCWTNVESAGANKRIRLESILRFSRPCIHWMWIWRGSGRSLLIMSASLSWKAINHKRQKARNHSQNLGDPIKN